MVRAERLRRLARALCVQLGTGPLRLERWQGKWWLCGAAGGDCALPQTHGARTEAEALEQAEAWLAPEIDAPLSIGPCLSERSGV
jgi:hypothetical protein